MSGPSFGPYSGAKVLVTGGLGFLGSHLAAKLVQLGSRVTIVDSLIPEYGGNPYNVRDISDDVHINYSDIRDPWSMRHLVQGQDYVFNLAGQVSHIDSMTDPETDLDINCRAQLSLLEALRERNPNARVVFAASRQQYGRPRSLPLTEDHPQVPVDVNGINLVAAESYHLLYHDVYGIPATSLRLTNTYGPHLLMKHGRQGLTTVFIRRAIEGKDIQLFGGGAQLRDFTYVSDAVDAFLSVAVTESCFGHAFNVGGDGPVSLRAFAHLVQDIAEEGGGVEAVEWPPEQKKIDIGSVYQDASRLRDATSWQVRVDVREGLTHTIAFYKAHGEHYWR